MSDAKYMDEHEADEAGHLLVDLLYGEVDDDDREQVVARVGEAELAGYGRLRAMMRELPEEEPPAALTAKLLHAAAMHAPQASAAQTGEARGVWAWLTSVFQPMLLHPGLAAAASLVLVVGVAGALYMTGRFEVAEPQHAVAPPSQVAEQAPSPELAEPAEPQRPASEPADSTMAPAEDRDSVAEAAAAPAPPGGMAKREEQREPARERKADKAVGSSASRSAGYAQKAKDTGAFADLMGEGAGRGSKGGSGSSSGIALDNSPTGPSGSVSSTMKKASKPMAPAPVATDTASDDGLAQADEAEAPAQQPRASAPARQTATESSGSRIRSLHDEARDAAKQGDCETVQQIGSSVRNLDAVYYRDVFRKDAQLARCLGS